MKGVSKKLLSVVLSIAMLMSMASIASVSALNANETITLHTDDGTNVKFLDEDGESFFNEDGTPFDYVEELGYSYAVKEGSTVNNIIVVAKSKLTKFTFAIEKRDGYTFSVTGASYTSQEQDAYVLYSCSVRAGASVVINVSATHAPATITFPAPSNDYTITSDEDRVLVNAVPVPYGEDYSFTVRSDNASAVPEVKVNGVALPAVGTDDGYRYTISADTVNENPVVSIAMREAIVVSLPSGVGYKADPVGATTSVPYGGTFQFTVEPDAGYTISSVRVNGTTVTATANVYTIENVTSAPVINVAAVRSTHTVTVNKEGTGYTTTARDTVTVNEGDDYSFIVTPADGYNKPSVTATEGVTLIQTGDTYTVQNITKDVTITIKETGKQSCVVTLPSGVGYKAAPVGDTTSVPYGESFQFTVTPDTGYTVSSVRVNGDIVTADTNGVYTIDKVTSAPVINVTAVRTTYTVTVQNTGNNDGYTTTARNMTVNEGDDYGFVVTPAAGYKAPTVTVVDDAGKTVPFVKTGDTYTVQNITKNVTITISKPSKQRYTVTLNQGTGYTIKATSATTVEHDDSFTFTVEPTDGYTNSTLVVAANNVILNAQNGVYTISNVTADQVVTVTGAVRNTYTVSWTPNAETYTLTALDNATVQHGGTFRFTVTPKAGFDGTANVTVNGEPVPFENGTYTLSNITNNVAIQVDRFTAQSFIVKDVTSDKTGYTLAGESNTVSYNGNVTLTVTPKTGYRIVSVCVVKDGNVVATLTPFSGDQYLISNITESKDIRVEAKQVTYTVTYVNSKNTSDNKTVVYRIDNAADGNITLSTDVSAKNYEFAYWADANGTKVETLTLGAVDQTITLYAQWTPVYDDLFKVTIDDTTAYKPTSNGRYRLRIVSSWLADDMDEVRTADVIGVGVFYAQSADAIAAVGDALKDAAKNVLAGDGDIHGSVKVENKPVYCYYTKDTIEATELEGSFAQSFDGIAAGKDRAAMAWVAVKVNGEVFVYLSDIWTGTAPAGNQA